MTYKHNTQSGFSLIEIVILIAIIGLVSAFAYSRLWGREDAGAGERALNEAASRVTQRRDEAIRLNGNRAQTSLESEVAPLVVMDFGDRQRTGSLIIDGVDADGDHRDDETGDLLTHLSGNDWVYSYRDDAMTIADGWMVYSTRKLRRFNLPLIGGGESGRGIPVTSIGFDASGRAYGLESDGWKKFPTGAETEANPETSPFWAVYFIKVKENGSLRETELKGAVAIAVYPSGQTEKFRFDGENWLGFRARNVGGKSKKY